MICYCAIGHEKFWVYRTNTEKRKLIMPTTLLSGREKQNIVEIMMEADQMIVKFSSADQLNIIN